MNHFSKKSIFLNDVIAPLTGLLKEPFMAGRESSREEENGSAGGIDETADGLSASIVV